MTRPLLLGVGAAAALVVAFGAALAGGSADLSAGEVAAALQRGPGAGDVAATVVWELRMPRALLALAVGGGLAVVGVAMQALVRNPLAEPYVLGVSSGASAGASLFYLGFLPPVLSRALSLPLAAFLGALGTLVVVFLVARTGPRLSTARLLLAGVAVSSFLAAVTAFVTYASPDPNRLRAVLFWLLGSLAGARWSTVGLPLAGAVGGALALLALARPLDALLTGEEPARTLGVPVENLKRALMLLSALVTGLLVAASGIIGFVGLIVPHAVRFGVGAAHRRVVPLAFLLGALFLLLADLAARTVLPGQELPVGILTALCGVPFFLVLLRRTTRLPS
ncbi:MAG TPA: iron ABC transporter permease [Rubricoccaceae bacterium]|nr:iron ABC transporter permease [Rubricoccaceae bacterium]